MRKLIMAVAVLGMSATMNFAKAQCVNEYGNKEPFAVEFSRLSSYLGLAPYQMEEVLNINDYFVQEQRKSLSKDLKRQDERLAKSRVRQFEADERGVDCRSVSQVCHIVKCN